MESGRRQPDSAAESEPPAKKRAKQPSPAAQQAVGGLAPAPRVLTPRQAIVSRLVAAHKFEAMRLCKRLAAHQQRWTSELEHGVLVEPPGATPPAASHHQQVSAPTVVSGLPWTRVESEVLRKAFLTFGVGRWTEIERAVHLAHPASKHQGQEIASACWDFVAQLRGQVTGSDAAYVDALLSKRPPDLPGVPGGLRCNKPAMAAGPWARRLEFLAQLHRVQQAVPQAQIKAKLQGMPDTQPIAAEWNLAMDVALLHGTWRLGYGAYDAIRTDPEYANAFRPFNDSGEYGGTYQRTCWSGCTDRLARSRDTHQKKPLGVRINWSKEEKAQLVEAVMRYGPPPALPGKKSQLDWAVLRSQADVADKPESAVAYMYRRILSDSEALIKQHAAETNAAPSSSSKPAGMQSLKGVLTLETAHALRARVGMGDGLRAAVVLPSEISTPLPALLGGTSVRIHGSTFGRKMACPSMACCEARLLHLAANYGRSNTPGTSARSTPPEPSGLPSLFGTTPTRVSSHGGSLSTAFPALDVCLVFVMVWGVI
ncbi:hypothetical protein WJX72_010726 [[Myrmecia] bisecta]|uniref:Myb-like domain-containing protein n=1 Tax=[Myrmecia] bisecta TaxID=41462 RepID=A0AAW1PTT2_9CHLO